MSSISICVRDILKKYPYICLGRGGKEISKIEYTEDGQF